MAERRLIRRQRDLGEAQAQLSRCQQQAAARQVEPTSCDEPLARFIEDNRTNPSPVQAFFRLGGGFGTGSNVALLIETPYRVYSKVPSYQIVEALRQRASSGAWLQVGKKAITVAWENTGMSRCAYPSDLAREGFLRVRDSSTPSCFTTALSPSPTTWMDGSSSTAGGGVALLDL